MFHRRRRDNIAKDLKNCNVAWMQTLEKQTIMRRRQRERESRYIFRYSYSLQCNIRFLRDQHIILILLSYSDDGLLRFFYESYNEILFKVIIPVLKTSYSTTKGTYIVIYKHDFLTFVYGYKVHCGLSVNVVVEVICNNANTS